MEINPNLKQCEVWQLHYSCWDDGIIIVAKCVVRGLSIRLGYVELGTKR
jgi:hypothetical protein